MVTSVQAVEPRIIFTTRKIYLVFLKFLQFLFGFVLLNECIHVSWIPTTVYYLFITITVMHSVAKRTNRKRKAKAYAVIIHTKKLISIPW